MEDVEARFENALLKFDGNNFDRLDGVDRILVAIWGIEAEVNNGGFHQYYFNGAGDQAFFAPNALAVIGARRMAEIARKANSLFGPGGPPRSREDRQARLEALTANDESPWDELDGSFQAYPDDIRALLEAFLASRPAG
jgi:hypothetical protein